MKKTRLAAAIAALCLSPAFVMADTLTSSNRLENYCSADLPAWDFHCGIEETDNLADRNNNGILDVYEPQRTVTVTLDLDPAPTGYMWVPTGDATITVTVFGDHDSDPLPPANPAAVDPNGYYDHEWMDVDVDGLSLGRIFDGNLANDEFNMGVEQGWWGHSHDRGTLWNKPVGQAPTSIYGHATLAAAKLADLIKDNQLVFSFGLAGSTNDLTFYGQDFAQLEEYIDVKISFEAELVLSDTGTPPTAKFSASAMTVAAPGTVTFDATASSDAENDISTYAWSFGDGESAQGSQVTHEFTEPGLYLVSLSLTDAGENSASATTTIRVLDAQDNLPPEANLAVSGIAGSALGFDFDASGSQDFDGVIETYEWDFGDGESAEGEQVSHIYNSAGEYSVALTVTDLEGETSTVTTTVVANGEASTSAAPKADITQGYPDASDLRTVQLTANATNGTIVSYQWDMGDGTVLEGAQIEHRYANKGVYQVTLRLTSGSGGTTLITRNIVIAGAAPVATFSASALSGKTPFVVTLDASASSDTDADIASFKWTFGDGTSAEGMTATHNYTVAGNYDATLTVTDSEGQSSSFTRTLTATLPVQTIYPSDDVGASKKADAATLSSSYWDHAFLKFPLDEVSGDIGKATLRIYANSGANIQSYLWAAFSDSWSETAGAPKKVGFNWASTPICSSEPHSAKQWVECDVTDFIIAQRAADGIASFELSNDSNGWQSYQSSEGVNRPYLYIEGATDNPEDSTTPVANVAPAAAITLSATTGLAPLEISFDASESSDSDGAIVGYNWNFGDGSANDSSQTTTHSYTVAGTYTVTLTVTDNEGLSHTATQSVVVSEVVAENIAPVASFATALPDSATPLTIAFDASASSDSDGTITGYSWNFGDGSSGNGTQASHTFAAGGSYTVTLTVTDDSGASHSSSQSISVTAPTVDTAPVAALSVSSLTAKIASAIEFDASESSDDKSGLTFSWQFGDGSSATGVTARHAYAASGNFTVTLTVTDSAGQSGSTTSTIEVTPNTTSGPASTIELTPSDDIGASKSALAQPLNFNAWSHAFFRFPLETLKDVEISKATIRLYAKSGGERSTRFWAASSDSWTENGTLPAAQGFDWMGSPLCETPPHRNGAYIECDVSDFIAAEAAGDGVASFEVSNSAGGWQQYDSRDGDHPPLLVVETAGGSGVISNEAPVAIATSSSTSGEAPLSISFDGSNSLDNDGGIVSYQWNFGDGSMADTATSSHEYLQAGSYTATLTVTDDQGAGNTANINITVTAPTENQAPVAQAHVTPMSGTAPLTVNVDGTSSTDSDGSIASYSWDFGDGTQVDSATTSHIYTDAGSYTALLTVTDDNGARNTVSTAIIVTAATTEPVNEAPVAAISNDNDSPTVGEVISLDALASSDDKGIVSYNWQFGDDTSAQGQTTTHSYDTAGNFTISLTVTDAEGATSTTTRIVNVSSEASGGTTGGSLLVLSPTDDIGGDKRATLSPMSISYWDHGFLRFDLGAVSGSVTKATVRVYANSSSAMAHTFYAASSDSWTQASGAPTKLGFPWMSEGLCTTVKTTGPAYFECDVTSFVASEAGGDGVATFELASDSNGWKTYDTREGANPPELVVETDGGPNSTGSSETSSKVRIVTIGNSITQGNSTQQSYRYPLWKMLLDAGLEHDMVGSQKRNSGGNPAFSDYLGQSFDPDNEGHWGWRTDQLANGLPSWLGNYDADIALLHTGSNDIIQGQSNASTIDEIRSVIAILRADNPAITILLAQLIPVDTEMSHQPSTVTSSLLDLNDRIATLAMELDTSTSRIVLVDQYSGFNASTDTVDGIHPNEPGQTKMAQKWFDAISSLNSNDASSPAPSVPVSGSNAINPTLNADGSYTYNTIVTGLNSLYGNTGWHNLSWWGNEGFNPVEIPVVGGTPVSITYLDGKIDFDYTATLGARSVYYGAGGSTTNGLANNGVRWYSMTGLWVSNISYDQPYWSFTPIGNVFEVGNGITTTAPANAVALLLAPTDPNFVVDQSEIDRVSYFTQDLLGRIDNSGHWNIKVTSNAAPTLRPAFDYGDARYWDDVMQMLANAGIDYF